MSLKTFKGGVHPSDSKSMSMNAEITHIEPSGELVYFLNQHIGAPASPVVNTGDRVLIGQTIANAASFVSADIIASVSGTVKAVEPRTNQNGDHAMAIVVENDFKNETTADYGVKRELANMTKDEIKDAIKKAGIVGMGGAGFPTIVKLAVKEGTKIDHIICNGAECEPYITCDYRLMLEKTSLAVEGMSALLAVFDDATGVFGIESNKPEGIKAVSKAISGFENIHGFLQRKRIAIHGEQIAHGFMGVSG